MLIKWWQWCNYEGIFSVYRYLNSWSNFYSLFAFYYAKTLFFYSMDMGVGQVTKVP